jgi:CubicO group peptidase (beta-lactamase class C family)
MTSLALSWLWAVARSAGVSAQEGGRVSSVDERIKRFEQQLEDLRRALTIPGISAAIVKDGKLLWAKGIGFADVEHKVPATPETNYRIASLTKSFASTLLMQLVEQGKLDLDEPMGTYSPEFRQRFGGIVGKIVKIIGNIKGRSQTRTRSPRETGSHSASPN